jgi:penicillin V acylase-like amidase (Ntn superfamily)
MKIGKCLLMSLVVLLFIAGDAIACTTFCFMDKGAWVYGRNYDWYIEHCLIMVNKRGVLKTALTQDNPAQWTARYGSITFNQYGREFPLGGMNEAGLVIEVMWLEYTEYPHPDSRKAVSDLQWVQYQLDNCSTVDEVIASNDVVRITVRRATPLHFLVCDRSGKAAAIEFLGGKMVVHTGEELPATVLTNNTYSYSLRLYEAFDGDEKKEAFAAAGYSLKRFVWAAQGTKNWDPSAGRSPIDYAFGILDKVAVSATQFRIVYDVGNGRIYYRCKSNGGIRSIDVKKFDYSCDKQVKVLDIVLGGAGDVTGMFSDYTYEANYDLINRSYSDTDFLKETPENLRGMVARYPESLPCKD